MRQHGERGAGGDGSISRRRVLAAVGTATAVGLAGCGGDESDPGGEAGDGGDPGDGSEGGDDSGNGGGSGDGGSGGGETDAMADGGGSGGPGTDAGGETLESGSGETGSSNGAGASGQVTENTIDALEVLEAASSTDGEYFQATLVVENDGQQQVELANYEYELTLYDDAGSEIDWDVRSEFSQAEPAAGESGEVTVRQRLTSRSPADVASYDIAVRCGSFNDGVHCSEE